MLLVIPGPVILQLGQQCVSLADAVVQLGLEQLNGQTGWKVDKSCIYEHEYSVIEKDMDKHKRNNKF